MTDEQKEGKPEDPQMLSAQSDADVYTAIRAALVEARTSVIATVNTAMVGVTGKSGGASPMPSVNAANTAATCSNSCPPA